MGANYITFYWALIVVMVAWMAIRIAKVSTGMAVAAFLCWPIAVIPLITNWGQRGSDIRLQFLVTAVASILLWNTSATFVGENPSLLYTQDEIEQIRASDPVFAAEIEREQLRALGIDTESASDVNLDSPAAASAERSPRAFVSPTAGSDGIAATSAPGSMEFAAAPPTVARIPLRELNFRRGNARLNAAFARIQVPRHFRFIGRHQLGLLSERRGIPVSDQTLGWIIHERVDLNSARFWFVDVQFHEIGHLAPPAVGADAPLVQWNPATAIAIFGQPAGGKGHGTDQSAAKLTRHGAILFRVPELKDEQLELGLRAARLMAARTVPDQGWAHAEYIGESSPQTLAQWVESLKASAQPTEMAEADDGKHSS
ncbi:MAG: hypothetical protein IPK27_22475 [Rhodanobacteraceae bacterium]|nr:hypothetical protein [Rhodanobacteraceae bacterium]